MRSVQSNLTDMPHSSFVKSDEPMILSQALTDVLESKRGTLKRTSSDSLDKIQRMVESYLVNSKEKSLTKNKKRNILKIISELRTALDELNISDISRTY